MTMIRPWLSASVAILMLWVTGPLVCSAQEPTEDPKESKEAKEKPAAPTAPAVLPAPMAPPVVPPPAAAEKSAIDILSDGMSVLKDDKFELSFGSVTPRTGEVPRELTITNLSDRDVDVTWKFSKDRNDFTFEPNEPGTKLKAKDSAKLRIRIVTAVPGVKSDQFVVSAGGVVKTIALTGTVNPSPLAHTGANVMEWGVIGEVKPFVTRQMTAEEEKKRLVCKLEYRVHCSCACGYCCCRLCPIEVLEEQTYSVHSWKTFVVGPPLECWEATVTKADKNALPKIELHRPLTYFATKDVGDEREQLRFQASVRHPDEGRPGLPQYSWSPNRATMPVLTEGKTIVLVWNILNDTKFLPGIDSDVTFHAPPGVEVHLQAVPTKESECRNLQVVEPTQLMGKDTARITQIVRAFFVPTKPASTAPADHVAIRQRELLTLSGPKQKAATEASELAIKNANVDAENRQYLALAQRQLETAKKDPANQKAIEAAERLVADADKKVKESTPIAEKTLKDALDLAKDASEMTRQAAELIASASTGPVIFDVSGIRASWNQQKAGTPAPFDQIRDHFKIDREFRAIRSYERPLP